MPQALVVSKMGVRAQNAAGSASVSDLGLLTRSCRRPGRRRYACGAVLCFPSQPPSAAVLLRLLGRPMRRHPAVRAGGTVKKGGSSLQANRATAHRFHLIFLMSHPGSAQYLGTVIARWSDAPTAAGWRDWAALHAARVPGHDGPRSPFEAQAPPAFSGAPAGGDTLASCASMAAASWADVVNLPCILRTACHSGWWQIQHQLTAPYGVSQKRNWPPRLQRQLRLAGSALR